MTTEKKYDYIIAGAGCAGLSLVMHMIHSGKFNDKKILIVDKELKNKNDRTWCFWEKDKGLFEGIVFRKWDKVWFHSGTFSKLLELQPYQYKLIRGIDFYTHCLSVIKQQTNIEIVTGAISELKSESGKNWVVVNGQAFTAEYIFNSLPVAITELNTKGNNLLQHFKGWVINTKENKFRTDEATLMDFRVDQPHNSGGATFVYVMPFSPTQALVEYTLFSDKLLPEEQYNEGLENYISRFLNIDEYEIEETEFGVIPMTDYRFPVVNGSIINIGTAGGQTKASSGYTFKFIQKHSARIVANLIKRKNPFIALPGGPARYKFYDNTLLHVLKHNTVPGDKIFSMLFKKNIPQRVFRFLDNESSLLDEIKITSSLPTIPFLKAALKQRNGK